MENSKKRAKTHDSPTQTLTDALAHALAPFDAQPSGAPIAIALSGGLDSTSLLHAANAWLKARGQQVIALHVNHGLSEHAACWQHSCARLCTLLGVELCVQSVQIAQRPASLEAKARRLRYDALLAMAQQRGARVLLTAHHANDQAETVLLNLLRGSGVSGLRGIAARRPLADLQLVRPWLGIRRATIEAYAQAHQLRGVEDESNHDLRFTRNALRHVALPALEQIAPTATARLGTTARHAARAEQLLDELARIDLGPAGGVHEGLELACLAPLSDPRAANVLRFWLRARGAQMPGDARLEEWIRQLRAGRLRTHLSLGTQAFAIRGHRLVPLTPAPRLGRAPLALYWQHQEYLEARAWGGRLLFTPTSGPGLSAAQLLNEPLWLRARSGGERLQLHAQKPSRSLKNLYQEAGIAAPLRLALPLVYCANQLVYAAGLGMNLRACGTHQSPRFSLIWQPSQESLA